MFSIIGVKLDKVNNLFKTLNDDNDLNCPRKLPAETERELALVEEELQNEHEDHVDHYCNCIRLHYFLSILIQGF